MEKDRQEGKGLFGSSGGCHRFPKAGLPEPNATADCVRRYSAASCLCKSDGKPSHAKMSAV